MEYIIRVNRWGLVHVFHVFPNGRVQFWLYVPKNSIPWAIARCADLPTRITSTNQGL